MSTNGSRIGLMLYTVRDACARDFEGTLREVAEIGYEGVELFDLHGHEPARSPAGSPSSGWSPSARHASLDAIEGDLPALAAEARTLGYAPAARPLGRPLAARRRDAARTAWRRSRAGCGSTGSSSASTTTTPR